MSIIGVITTVAGLAGTAYGVGRVAESDWAVNHPKLSSLAIIAGGTLGPLLLIFGAQAAGINMGTHVSYKGNPVIRSGGI